MTKPMMKCGHRANATDGNGNPSCAICFGLDPGADVVNENTPDLTGRYARCSCGNTRPSTDGDRLAFFEYRGPGSRAAEETCTCGYYKSAHEGPGGNFDHSFKARGDVGNDLYYCGCRGWD